MSCIRWEIPRITAVLLKRITVLFNESKELCGRSNVKDGRNYCRYSNFHPSLHWQHPSLSTVIVWVDDPRGDFGVVGCCKVTKHLSTLRESDDCWVATASTASVFSAVADVNVDSLVIAVWWFQSERLWPWLWLFIVGVTSTTKTLVTSFMSFLLSTSTVKRMMVIDDRLIDFNILVISALLVAVVIIWPLNEGQGREKQHYRLQYVCKLFPLTIPWNYGSSFSNRCLCVVRLCVEQATKLQFIESAVWG